MSPFCGPSFHPGLLSVGFILEEETMEEEFLPVFPVLSLSLSQYHSIRVITSVM